MNNSYIVYQKYYNIIIYYLWITVFLASIFMLLQGYEYKSSVFFLTDGYFGSVFYMLTGLHGFHVFIGNILIKIVLWRLWLLEIKFNTFNKYNFVLKKKKIISLFNRVPILFFSVTIWYWHFVDIVWIILFILLYFLAF